MHSHRAGYRGPFDDFWGSAWTSSFGLSGFPPGAFWTDWPHRNGRYDDRWAGQMDAEPAQDFRSGVESSQVPPCERRRPSVRLRRAPFVDPFASSAWSDDEGFPFGGGFWTQFPPWWYERPAPAVARNHERPGPSHGRKKRHHEQERSVPVKHRDSPERQLPRLIEERQDLGVQPVKVKFPSPARVVPQTPSPPPATPPRTWTPTPVTPATDIPVDFALPEDSTITNRELLLSSLSSLNISYKDLGGSGNCLFLSLSDQLANYHSTSSQPAQPRFPKLSARQIRAIVVDEIATNRELYKWDVLAMSTSKDSDSNPEAAYDSYVDSMAKPETYGDAICLAAFARVFDCGIAVWMWDHSKNRVGRVVVEWEDAEDREHDEGEKRRLNVAWMPSERGEAGNHYISVYPPGEIELRGVGH